MNFKRSRGNSSSSKSDESDNTELKNHSKILLPAVRPPSAKGTPKNHVKNDSESITLPAISPEIPKSSPKKDDFSLPVLSPPGTSSSPDEPKIPDSQIIDEIFKDSLNVTPEPLDTPLRPDSLEPEELQEVTNNDLKEKLLEIQEVEKNIEKAFNTERVEVDLSKDPSKEKLLESMEVEKDNKKVLLSVKESEENHVNNTDKDEEKNQETSPKNQEPNKTFIGSSDTYILSEGSPNEIPETVTTVIIPDCPQTPDSDSLKNDLISGLNETIIELDESLDVSLLPTSVESPLQPEEEPEMIIIPKTDLQPINEDKVLEKELKDDTPLAINSTKDAQETEEEFANLKSTSRLDTLDISADFTGLENTSTSSTSAKETTATDGAIELSKFRENSVDVEELNSESVSAESTNEAKETTVTDGTSFSLDPMRPFVPELNLDSLQDITVSSFKMTEDEYEEPGENDQENTNSITETLTPDEHKKVTTAGKEEDEVDLNVSEFGEVKEVVEESETTVSEELPLNQLRETVNDSGDQEIIEETCVREFVEIEEPSFEKITVRDTEPSVEAAEKSASETLNIPEAEEVGEKLEVKFDGVERNEEIVKKDLEKTSEIDETEDNFVDDDTPLAVSRSASQCTTRRVSSGNLTRLKEEQRLEEGEETELIEEEKIPDCLNDGVIDESGELDDLVSAGNSMEDENNGGTLEEAREYHIYVPELDQTEDTTSTESSFNSAATKIQAGVRGFLTRRRFQRMHHLNSTLNGVPSIQDSIVIDENPIVVVEPAEELEDAAKKIQSNFRGYKARQRLRREDAMQRTTISMERAFADDGIRHTGEFHDCIPLPLYDTTQFNEKIPIKIPLINDINNSPKDFLAPKQSEPKNSQKECGLMYEISPSVQFGMAPKVTKLVDVVVLTRDESAVQSGYLNFITSVEDSNPDSPNIPSKKSPVQLGPDDERNDLLSGESAQESSDFSPRRGVIIEEITSLEEAKILEEIKRASEARESSDNVLMKDEKSQSKDLVENKDQNVKLEVEVVDKEETNSMIPTGKIENKLLHYGSEDYPAFHEFNLSPGNPIKSLSLSQESQLAGERYESPVTMMQIVPPTRSESLARDDSSDVASNDEKINVGSLNTEGIKDQRKPEADENLEAEKKII